jgi:hypothetical protein
VFETNVLRLPSPKFWCGRLLNFDSVVRLDGKVANINLQACNTAALCSGRCQTVRSRFLCYSYSGLPSS